MSTIPTDISGSNSRSVPNGTFAYYSNGEHSTQFETTFAISSITHANLNVATTINEVQISEQSTNTPDMLYKTEGKVKCSLMLENQCSLKDGY